MSNLKLAISLISPLTIIFASLNQPVAAQQIDDVSFECSTHRGKPATVAVTPSEREKPMILWNPQGQFTAEERCELVSNNFQLYMSIQGMDSITLSNLRGLPVFCAYSSRDEIASCKGQLFTARSWESARNIRVRLEGLPYYLSSPIEQSDEDSFSFDLISYLSDIFESSALDEEVFPITQ